MRKRNLRQWYKRGSWWRRLWLNRKYKDALFRYLFRDKQHLLELYNALNGSTYKDPGELEVVTLEDVIFMKMKNDLSFIIGSTLNLYEHQSTWNPNMPLRGLLYFAEQFEGLLSARGDDIYGKKHIELPTPVYIVFYNGSGMQTDKVMLYLSDSFSAGRGTGCLECTCEVLNINRGHNGVDREEAVETAIDTCIEKDILKDVLLKQKAEVLHMLLTHYDEKKHLRNTFMEGREEGRMAGREEKLREQIQKKLSKGKSLTEIAEELEEETTVIEQIINKKC